MPKRMLHFIVYKITANSGLYVYPQIWQSSNNALDERDRMIKERRAFKAWVLDFEDPRGEKDENKERRER